MKINIFFLSIILIFYPQIVIYPAYAVDLSGWTKINEEKDIRIYIKKKPESEIIIARGISILDANILEILSVIKNNSRFNEWVPRLLNAHTIMDISNSEWVEYILLDSPWPLKNRDFVLKKKLIASEDNKQIKIDFFSINIKDKPYDENYVRAEIYQGYFLLNSINENKTHIDVTTHADLKGNIPDWAVNYIQKIWPMQTLKALKNQIEKIK